MSKRAIGSSSLSVSPIGLGCMGLSEFYGPPIPTADGVKLLHEAVDLGVDHFDTAELYGMGANERLLGEAFADRRDKVVIATKWGPTRDLETGAFTGVDGSPANMRRAVEQSLRHLKTDVIDLYYLHRIDPNTPIEDSVGAMTELVNEGKVRAIGLSEAGAETIRRAHAVHPIAAVQSEYSIFSRDIERAVLPTLRELGISLTAYSPLGRGMLTGAFKRQDDVAGSGDARGLRFPRFTGEAFDANLALVKDIEAVAAAENVAPGQVALAWVLGRGDDIITIPGTTKLANLESNLGALDVALSAEQAARLDALADRVEGTRYAPEQMASLEI